MCVDASLECNRRNRLPSVTTGGVIRSDEVKLWAAGAFDSQLQGLEQNAERRFHVLAATPDIHSVGLSVRRVETGIRLRVRRQKFEVLSGHAKRNSLRRSIPSLWISVVERIDVSLGHCDKARRSGNSPTLQLLVQSLDDGTIPLRCRLRSFLVVGVMPGVLKVQNVQVRRTAAARFSPEAYRRTSRLRNRRGRCSRS